MFENFNKEVCHIFKDAEQEMFNLHHPYVGSEHLLLSLLKNDSYTKSFLQKKEITYNDFKKELLDIVGVSNKVSEYVLYTPLLRRIINDAIEKSLNHDGLVTGKDLFISLINENDGIALNILKNMGVNLKELKNSNPISNNLDTLKEFCTLLNPTDNKLIGRDQEIEEIINVLLKKNKSNPLLIGKSGVGKTAIIGELVNRIKNNLVPTQLRGYEIYSLNLGTLVSGTKYRGDFENRFNNILNEISGHKIILFIDEIHGINETGSSEGSLSAKELLKPYLQNGNIKIIGATTEREYNSLLSKDKALIRRFSNIRINEPSINETYKILKGIKKEYEEFHNVIILDEILNYILEITSKYLNNRSNPDKSIEILDIVSATKNNNLNNQQELSKLEQEKENYLIKENYKQAELICEQINSLKNTSPVITKNDIDNILINKYGVNIKNNYEENILNLKNNFHKLIGQEKVKNKLLSLIDYKLKNNHEVLSVLLLGSTGVGKTETVKIIADSIKNVNYIRLDMSEYNLETAVNKLIGVSSGYVGYNDSYEFEKIKLNPNTIILVDEVEKAHPKVINLFLQILDEGFITDAQGDKINFHNSMIFFTSNLGNKNSVGFMSKELNDLEDFFAPELLGRIDSIIKFKDINEEDVINYLNKYKQEHNLKFDNQEVIEKSNYQKYGLRNIKKTIKNIMIEEKAYNL